ncbi:hypothetical protein [Methylosinus sp. PW1]|uniref:hypothetical protein n=1 Tax=Methylosinus sp. PW1 TaxID=107636 RepID=UPI0012EBC2CC|nr:hypothetical protein [Methylosinus sp. PW1]
MVESGIPPFKWAPGFAETLAEIANNWAHIEFAMNQSIWILSGLSSEAGACITSQIFTLQGRLAAVKSLLELVEAPKPLLKQVNKFSENVRGATEKRNRALHDMWLVDIRDENIMARMEITAPGHLSFEPKPHDLLKIQNDLAVVAAARKEAFAIRNAIQQLPTLPTRSKSIRDPMDGTY